MNPKIKFTNVSKSFSLYKKQSEKLIDIISYKKDKEQFYALNNISFEIFEGEAIGIVGLNGSGKSTLSNLLAQVVPPTSGTIEINGETSLIAISAGLNNSLTGLENIELKCLMHGLNKSEIERLKPHIIEFADIGDFISQPVKNYSSGMKSRLGFAISVHTNPDILIVDEALSVGDQTFYQKCLDKINKFKAQGKTIIFVSHSISQIKAFCNRVIWVHFGRVKMFDEANKVLNEYTKFIKWFNTLSEEEKKHHKSQMLDEQYRIGPTSTSNHKKDSNKKSRFLFYSQLFIMSLLVVLSASYMFGMKPIEGIISSQEKIFSPAGDIEQIPNDDTVKKTESYSEVESKLINKNGIIKISNANVYQDKNLNKSIGELPFAEYVFIISQVDNNYRIELADGENGYIKIEHVEVLDNEIPLSSVKVSDFIATFPDTFNNVYEYFFSFLGSTYDDVISKVGGLTNEVTLELGNKILSYGRYDAHFVVNNNDVIESIIIDNLSTNVLEGTTKLNETSYKSDDGNLLLYITSNYKITIDTTTDRATFTIH